MLTISPGLGNPFGGTSAAPGLGNPLGGNGQVNIGPIGRMGLMAASMIPGPLGFAATLGGLGLRGSNTFGLSNIAGQEGLQGLSAGQTLGGLLGLNGYGTGAPEALSKMLANNGVTPDSATSLPFNPSNLQKPGDYFSQLSNNGMGGMAPPTSPGFGVPAGFGEGFGMSAGLGMGNASSAMGGGGFSPGAASGADAG